MRIFLNGLWEEIIAKLKLYHNLSEMMKKTHATERENIAVVKITTEQRNNTSKEQRNG